MNHCYYYQNYKIQNKDVTLKQGSRQLLLNESIDQCALRNIYGDSKCNAIILDSTLQALFIIFNFSISVALLRYC